MRSALRKMGNSTGMIVPSAVLREAGLASGALLEISVDAGRIIATPVVQPIRAGWQGDAMALPATTVEEAEWLDMPNASDADLAW